MKSSHKAYRNKASKSTQKPKIIFFGTSEFAIPIFEALMNKKYTVSAIVTKSDKPAGRKQTLTPSPLKRFAQYYKLKNMYQELEILQPEKLTVYAPNTGLKLTADLFIVAAYGKIIPKNVLGIPSLGALNIHPSLLPKYRGPSPIQTALLNGESETGTTIMLMDEKMDHGKIISNSKIQIANDDNYRSLHNKLAKLSAKLLIDILPGWISGAITPREQDHNKATFTKMIRKIDGKIDWTRSAQKTYNQIRALNPGVGTWTHWNNKIIKVIKAQAITTPLEQNNEKTRPGTVFLIPKKAIAVTCGNGALQLEQIQLEGKKTMAIKEFLNGYSQFIGARLA